MYLVCERLPTNEFLSKKYVDRLDARAQNTDTIQWTKTGAIFDSYRLWKQDKMLIFQTFSEILR